MCAGAAVMASLSPVRAVFTVALIVVLALKLAEEEEALKAARPEEWAKYSEILGFDIDFSILDFHGFP
jgi:protein-S-isoprenylcysteine O-methyltransferase Ste14